MTEGNGRERIRRECHNAKARDTVVVNSLGTEPKAPPTYAPGSEHHQPNMIKIGWGGGQLDIYI